LDILSVFLSPSYDTMDMDKIKINSSSGGRKLTN